METGRSLSPSEVRSEIQINLLKSANDLKKDLASQLIDGLEKASPAGMDEYIPSTAQPAKATYSP